MKNKFLLLFIMMVVSIIFSPIISNASTLIIENEVTVVEPFDIRRMWIERHPVPGNGPATYYYSNGYWHGYLQKVGFFPSNPQSFSYYSGYLYPIGSPIPMPSKNLEFR